VIEKLEIFFRNAQKCLARAWVAMDNLHQPDRRRSSPHDRAFAPIHTMSPPPSSFGVDLTQSDRAAFFLCSLARQLQ
jgi:hypothetical protein